LCVAHLIAPHRLAHGRKVRQRLRAHRGGDREPTQLAGSDVFDGRSKRGEQDVHLPAEQIRQCRSITAIRDVDQIDASHHFEQFAREMASAPDTGRRHVDLAWIGLGIGNELGDRRGRNGWIDHQDEGTAGDACDRCDVADEIEPETAVERRVGGIRRSRQEQSISVGRRIHDRLRGDVRSSARPVLDDEGLAEPLRQPLSNQPRDDVVPAGRGKADDKAHRPGRIGLRPRDPRHRGAGGSARCQMEELSSVGKFHAISSRNR